VAYLAGSLGRPKGPVAGVLGWVIAANRSAGAATQPSVGGRCTPPHQ
jgi:hypothetical protein